MGKFKKKGPAVKDKHRKSSRQASSKIKNKQNRKGGYKKKPFKLNKWQSEVKAQTKVVPKAGDNQLTSLLKKAVPTQNSKSKNKSKWNPQNKIEHVKLLTKKKAQARERKNAESVKEQGEPNKAEQKSKKKKLNAKRLEEMLMAKQQFHNKKKESNNPESLRDRMMAQLRASRFRYLNETLYTNQSVESKKFFKEDPGAFTAYHEGYKQQINQWPVNPLDNIIASIQKMPKDYVIADFGCGEGRLASSVLHKVHSFDLVALNDQVTACDMSHTPLLTKGVNVVVFCLSLMGANLSDYLIEANRVLKQDGILKLAEVESRFDKVEDFISILHEYGFKNTWKDLSHNLFYFMDFKKEKDITGNRNKLQPVVLKTCLYKKR